MPVVDIVAVGVAVVPLLVAGTPAFASKHVEPPLPQLPVIAPLIPNTTKLLAVVAADHCTVTVPLNVDVVAVYHSSPVAVVPAIDFL